MEEHLKSSIAYELLVLSRKIEILFLKWEITDTVALNAKTH